MGATAAVDMADTTAAIGGAAKHPSLRASVIAAIRHWRYRTAARAYMGDGIDGCD
jgi:hypothetical protein